MAPLLSAPLLRTQSDGRLAALAADGHDRAFEAIVERYRRPLQRYLRRLLSEALAEDVLQASFVRAWQALRAGTEVRDLRPWLYRIAHNQAINTLRAAGAALPPSAEAPAVSLEAEVERREELRETLHGIEALPARQRAALVAIAVADRPHADVARELGMSDGALRQLLLRARTTLRAAATALTPYPLMAWLAGAQEVTAARVAEVAVGAGGAGVAIKASAAVLAAGAVVAGGPALREDHDPARAQAAPRAHEAQGAAARGQAAASPMPTPDHAAGDQGGGGGHGPRPAAASGHGGAGASGSGESESSGSSEGGSGHGSSGSDDSGSGGSGESGSGHGSGGSGSGDDGSGSSGSGSGSGDDGSGSTGSGSSGSGSGDSGSGGSGSSGSGSGKSGRSRKGEAIAPAAPAPALAPGADAPLPAVTTEPSSSGEGSGSSGSGSSGSGSDSSGSGSSGSG
jgi:RNA polymerase sigma factor (sigma-70 family)